ncbi:phosphotransferase [Arthrobacter castelli]|uniref:phosphotransferase n=1 Tax=Arthrobacter castelli TaxID=271431 RepID=UPI0004036887
MTRTPTELAAIASAAVPGLTPAGVATAPDDAADFQSAVLLDDAGKRWRVRSPKHAEASVRLETELHVLRCFTPAVRAELPFLLPNVAGTVRQGNLSTFVYSHVPGSTRSIDQLVAEPGNIAAELGRIMAAIHDLPLELVHSADLPSYSADEFRQRKLNELDQAATTGKIPSSLLLRWENALEDAALWQFQPSVVHGDLHEDQLLIDQARVTGVNGWTDMRIGDPADDFAWLIAANDQRFADSVLESYSVAVQRAPDRHLLRRAALSAEFAVAQWLVRGIAIDDPAVVAEAEEMLAALESDIAEYGGQPISADPPERPHSESVAPISTGEVETSDPVPDSRHDDDAEANAAEIPDEAIVTTGTDDDAEAAPEPGSDADDGPDLDTSRTNDTADQDPAGGADASARPADNDKVTVQPVPADEYPEGDDAVDSGSDPSSDVDSDNGPDSGEEADPDRSPEREVGPDRGDAPDPGTADRQDPVTRTRT